VQALGPGDSAEEGEHLGLDLEGDSELLDDGVGSERELSASPDTGRSAGYREWIGWIDIQHESARQTMC
jgi:hypothetical protein